MLCIYEFVRGLERRSLQGQLTQFLGIYSFEARQPAAMVGFAVLVYEAFVLSYSI